MLLPWRYWVMAIFLVSTGVMSYLMLTRFSMDMSLESWFQGDDPAKVSLDEFRAQFGSDDGVYIVYEAKDGDVFSQASISTLKQFIQELQKARLTPLLPNKLLIEQNQLGRIQRIDSLYSARYQLAKGDTLVSQKLLAQNFPTTDKQRQEKRLIALQQDSFKLAYFSKDFAYGGIRLKTDFGTQIINSEERVPQDTESQDLLMDDEFDLNSSLTPVDNSDVESNSIEYRSMQMDEYLLFMKDLRAITVQPKYQHFTFYFTGNAPMMEFAMESMGQAGNLMGIMVLIVMVLLWFLFRSLSAVVWPIVVIVGSAFGTIGSASLLGITLSNMVTLTFMLIFAVGIADCVHVLSAYISYRKEDLSHEKSMAQAYRKTGVPIFLTSVTTMCGMLALTVSDIPQISVFALTSAMGVFMAFILTIFVLPVLLDIWHPIKIKASTDRVKHKQHWLQPLLNRIPGWVSRRPLFIVVSYTSIFILFIYGASQVKVDSNFVELTRDGSSIRVTHELVDKHMMGGQNLEIMMDFGQSEALKQPEVLKVVDNLQRHIEKQYSQYVVKTFSLADFVKETHMLMNEGQIEKKIIPQDPNLSAQLLYLFDNANPEDRSTLVSDDYSKSHISIQLRNAGSYEYTEIFNSIRKDIEAHFAPLKNTYPQMEVQVTGSLALMMELVDHISWTQIKSFSFALLIITLLMMVTLGSLQGGLISMMPNLLPAFFTFGLLGLLGVPLDTDTLIIAPLIIGIAVDDTIHFLAHYRDAWYESGDVETALANTIQEVGQAVTFTTLILGLGFSMLAFSDYLGMAKTGIFGSMAIFVALSSDLLLLPALIQWLKPDLGRKRFFENLEAGSSHQKASL
ncbi:MAG: MMPL family transporter [Bermanella sp.]